MLLAISENTTKIISIFIIKQAKWGLSYKRHYVMGKNGHTTYNSYPILHRYLINRL